MYITEVVIVNVYALFDIEKTVEKGKKKAIDYVVT